MACKGSRVQIPPAPPDTYKIIAGVAELVYALVSKTSVFAGMRVRLPPPAPFIFIR